MEFKYIINDIGTVVLAGYISSGTPLTGSEPFSGFDIVDWRKDMATGEWVRNEPEPDFPHADRPIRVELTDAQITGIVLNEQTRPLMEWAYHVPNRKTDNGLVMWFCDFINPLLTEEQTEGLLISLGAIITRNNI